MCDGHLMLALVPSETAARIIGSGFRTTYRSAMSDRVGTLTVLAEPLAVE